jgi:tetratricopeptide (TPR) repeat protein
VEKVAGAKETRDGQASLWLYLLVAVAACLPYLLLPSKPLVYDAPATVLRNEAVQTGPLHDLFVVDFWGFPADADYATRSYRPLVSLTYASQARSVGNSVAAFHATDVALHALAAVLVALLVETLGVRRLWAAGAGALFALHPVQSEAVSSVVGRADVMAGVCLFAALIFHLRAGSRARPWLFEGAAMISLAASFLCKEYAVSFPFILIGTDLARWLAAGRTSRLRWVFWIGSLALLGAYLFLRFRLFGALGGVPMLAATDHPLFDAPLMTRLGTALRIVALSARLLVLPVGLNHHYRTGTIAIVDSPLHRLALAGIVLLGALLIFGLWWASRRRGSIPLIAWLLVALPLLPTLNLVSLEGMLFAERFLYVPVAGLVLSIAWALDRWIPTPARTRIALVGLVVALVVFGAMTAVRVEDWASDERLARSSLAAYPDGSEVWRDLGLTVGLDGRHEEALEAFEQSLRIEPKAPQTWKAYATALVNVGRHEEGAKAWRRCVELNPGDVGPLWKGLGQAEFLAGRLDMARNALSRAHGLMPGDLETASLYGEALLGSARRQLEAGNSEEAIRLAHELTKIEELPPHAVVLAGMVATAAGDEALARAWFDRALTQDPDLLRRKHDTALEHERNGRYGVAAEIYREILFVRPNHAPTLFNLGRVLILAGRPGEAIDPLRRGLEIQPDPRARALLEQAEAAPPQPS